MNKKGSQVSFAIAFMIFIGFVIFLFGIIKPLGNVETSKDFILNNLQEKIIQNVSGNLEIISVYNCSSLQGYSTNYENGLLKVYINDSQSLDLSGCSSNYEVGLRKKEKYIFVSKIRGLMQDYNSNYEGVKDYFDVPNKNDFSLGFIYENKTEINVSKEGIPNMDVFVKLTPINYFNENSREEGYLKITLW